MFIMNLNYLKVAIVKVNTSYISYFLLVIITVAENQIKEKH